jgi:hypothetical protein
VALILAGLLFVYAGLFLTETEEGQLQNRLQQLWVGVDDLQSRAMTRQAAFLQRTSRLVADGLVRLFGNKLFSAKSAASCLCFSLGSLYLSLAMFAGKMPLLSKPTLLVCSLILVTCGVSQKLRYLGFVVLAVATSIEAIGLRGSLAVYQASFGEIAFGLLFYVIGILSGIVFIALTRWSLGVASHLSSTPSIMAIILANGVLGAALVSSLAFVELLPYHVSVFGPRVGRSLISRPHGFLIFLYNVATTNLFTALLAFLVVLLLLTALIHRIVWPVISRPVYAAHRHGLIAQHKLLTAIGASCLLLAWPDNIVVRAMAKFVGLGE